MSSVMQDLRHTVRTLPKTPAHTATVILTLAIGIGANVAMFSTLDVVLLKPLPFEEPERLVMGSTTFSGRVNPWSSAPDYFDYRDRVDAFESLSTISSGPGNFTVTGGDEPEIVRGTRVSFDLFRTLGVDPILGRHFLAGEGEPGGAAVVMISHAYWEGRFGSAPDVVGQNLVVSGYPRAVIGVMPEGFSFMHDVDLWLPMVRGGTYASGGRHQNHNWLIVGRIEAGVSLEQAQTQVDVVAAQLQAEYPESNLNKALLLDDLHEVLVVNYRSSLFMMMLAVGLVLLIGCANVAGLILARGSMRRTEFSVRKALGASRLRLVRQLLTESLATAVAAGGLGVLMAIWLQALILRFLPMEVPGIGHTALSARMLLAAVLFSLLTGTLFGVAPALRGAKGNVVEGLRTSGRSTDTDGARFRSGLVVAQVALSIVLLIGSGLLARSFARLQAVDPGFDTEHLLTAEIQLPSSEYPEREQRVQFYSTLLESIRAIPGVTDAALTNQLPIRNPGNTATTFAADNPPSDRSGMVSVNQRAVFPGYFETMGIPLLAGREIEETDGADAPRVAVINQAMAYELFPNQDPIGQRVIAELGEAETLEIVGVVGDVRMNGIAQLPLRAMYMPYFQRPFLTMRLAVRTANDPTTVSRPLRLAVLEQNQNIPVAGLATMDELMARSTSERKVIAVSLSLFAFLAMFLAAMGLYGVLASHVTQRIHEIGIRLALGATGGSVAQMVALRGFRLVAVGIMVGFAGAFFLTRLIEGMLFETDSGDPATFLLVGVLFTIVSVLASFIPAWRAVRLDPVVALQTD